VIALIYEGNNQRLKNLITAEKIHITLKRSRIAILSVGVAALIGIFSFFNFIAPNPTSRRRGVADGTCI